jgi:hypothetical protein
VGELVIASAASMGSMKVSLVPTPLSVEVTANTMLPGAGGVPLNVSVKDGPAGSVSQLGSVGATDQVLTFPSAAQNKAEYGTPTVAAGRSKGGPLCGDTALMRGSAGFTVSVTLKLAVSWDASVTVAVKEAEAAPTGGVPVKNPVDVRISHDGKPVAAQV